MSEAITKAQPAVPVVSDEQIDAVSLDQWGPHHGAPLAAHRAFARAILALRPAVDPMTPEQREVLAALVVGACEHKTRTLLALRAIEATEAQYGIGITAKAEGGA